MATPRRTPISLGKRFASPLKKDHPRAKRAKSRESSKELAELRMKSPAVSPSSSRSVTPAPSAQSTSQRFCSTQSTVTVKEKLSATEMLVNTALLARIEALEAENSHFKKMDGMEQRQKHFRLEQVKHDDKLIRFYTGFVSYAVFLSFFNFLGPAVNELRYRGEKEGKGLRHRVRKLDPLNQLFLTLVKLKLNLKQKDLAFRFGISPSVVSRYITTWICFLYHHLSEIDWTPSVNQVMSTLPHSFRKLYPSTFAIIDGTEIFMETPSNLYMQSSTWSQYKHHNTMKFLCGMHTKWSNFFCFPCVCWLHI